MVLPAALTALALLLGYTSAADPPADFPGDETPYRVIPTGTVGPDNAMGTYLYGYNGCNEFFGKGAKGKIDDAYYDAWLITKYVRHPLLLPPWFAFVAEAVLSPRTPIFIRILD